MGLDYSFELTYPDGRGPEVLDALRDRILELGVVVDTVRWGGRSVALPGNGRVSRQFELGGPGSRIGFDTTIYLPFGPSDDRYRNNRKFERIGQNSESEMPVGIKLAIERGHKYGRFAFRALTTDTSKLFRDSISVRGWFLTFGRQTGSLEILFDDEGDGLPSHTGPADNDDSDDEPMRIDLATGRRVRRVSLD